MNMYLIITVLSAFLIIYHHAIYPLLLRLITQCRQTHLSQLLNFPGHPTFDVLHRRYQRHGNDEHLPSISILMPAFNEADYIAEKIRNLAQLDYPSEKVSVWVGCDGCTDETAAIAIATAQELECSHLHVKVLEFNNNRGKMQVLNELIQRCDSDLVALSDVSALIACDALLVAAAILEDDEIGAVAGGYQILNHGSEGEERYWQYQRNIKTSESVCGSVLGCHGAFYIFAAELYQPLPSNVINDDFVLPMQISKQGYRVVYAPEVAALELEQASENIDFKRRQRIAAGNLQQLIMLVACLAPSQGWLAFNFASGKALRVLMPLCLIILFLGSLELSFSFLICQIIFMVQAIGYGVVFICHQFNWQPRIPFYKSVHYLVMGHWCALIGSIAYLSGHYRSSWSKVSN